MENTISITYTSWFLCRSLVCAILSQYITGHIAGLPVVLKFLKFHSFPEIVLKLAIIWSECPDMDLCYAVATLFLQVMTTFILLTLSCIVLCVTLP